MTPPGAMRETRGMRAGYRRGGALVKKGDYPLFWGPFLGERMAAALRDTVAARPADEPQPVQAPIAPGELLDRLTILQIKSQRVTDADKLRAVRMELEALTGTRQRSLPHSEQL